MNIADQIAWEQECLERGSERYYANQERLRDTGQADQTDVGSYLLKKRLQIVADKLEVMANITNAGRGNKYNKLLKQVAIDNDYLKLGYVGLRVVLDSQVDVRKNKVTSICMDIGIRLESDLRCQMFEAAHPEYYGTVKKSFKQQNITDFTHMHKVMNLKFNQFGLEWHSWSRLYKIHVGQRVLTAVLAAFDDIFYMKLQRKGTKTTNIIRTSEEFDKWVIEFEKERGLMFPFVLPLKIPPNDWHDNVTKSAFYTNKMNAQLPLIKVLYGDAQKYVRLHDPIHHREAINKMQRTPWKINKQVLDVQREVFEQNLSIGMPSNDIITPPPYPEHIADIPDELRTEEHKEEITLWKAIAKAAYGRENKRKGQVLSYTRSSKLALELSEWDEFYFAYNCDFRGRIYCATAGLSPQGADTAKGLLCFAKEVVLGEDGVKWLAIQGANTYGEDKCSYEDRVKWIQSNKEFIQRTVQDPLGYREFWGSADKPYQFLSFCFEWAGCDYGRDSQATSKIPVGLDGSCNGLQHFSAMLRDSVGATATNLTNAGTIPADIYTEVAKVLCGKLENSVDPRASIWLRVGIDRKCTKRPVMTLPYGATQQSCRQYIMEYVIENWVKFDLDDKLQFDMAKFLTPILWKAIGEVVIAARGAMTWLQKNTTGDFMKWLTPLGFPVYQYYQKTKTIEVRTQIAGGCRLLIQDYEDAVPNKVGQRNGVAPNFVHSIDSTHMVMTINTMGDECLAMIHDDFGTHAGHTQKLFVNIRLAFLDLYTNHNPLEEWAEQVGVDTTTIPESGDYDIADIIDAKYFFG
jgi:DNA-directed RNA polymerase